MPVRRVESCGQRVPLSADISILNKVARLPSVTLRFKTCGLRKNAIFKLAWKFVESVLSHLLQGITLGFTASATPGPFQAFLLNHTVQHGKRRALPLCLAPLISDAPIIILMLCILTQLPQVFLRFIQIFGGLFLLYLAKGTLSTVWNGNGQNSAPAQPRNFQHAILMNLLSPGPYIFWGTITGPMFLKALSRSLWHAICFLGGFYTILIGGFIAFVIISSAALSMGRKTGRVMAIIAAMALFGFGVWQIWNGIAA